jgi:hypothetical protein
MSTALELLNGLADAYYAARKDYATSTYSLEFLEGRCAAIEQAINLVETCAVERQDICEEHR